MRRGKRTGIYYIDSSCLPVCHLKRHRRHKVFENIATFERTSVGKGGIETSFSGK